MIQKKSVDMEQYDVIGMSCAACSARVEKAVSSVSGVTSCTVNLLTNSMAVEGGSESEIILAVQKAGYDASKKFSRKKQKEATDNGVASLLKRFIISLVFLLILLYLSMGHVMWNFPLPDFLEFPLSIAMLQMLLAIIVMVINQKFFIAGFKGIIRLAPNMDSLVMLGSAASFIYSTSILFVMVSSPTPETLLHGLYFESAAMILTLITLGKALEAYSKGKTTDALKSLISLKPKTAAVIKDGKEIPVPADDLLPGDIFVVRAGESIAVDGIILEGSCAVDESNLTGESIPVDKKAGDTVKSATINSSGYIKCKATRVGENTTLSQIIKLVSDAVSTKAPIAKIADKVSGFFVPAVLGISVITLIIWLFIGKDIGFSLSRAISVLVISCPCALGLATPVAIMVGSGIGAKKGILFKTALSLEITGKAKTVVLDKTGTITKGEPEVTDLWGNGDLLLFAYSLEKKSEHPLAKAIVKKGEHLKNLESSNFEIFSGGGLSAIIDGHKISGGSKEFILKHISLSEESLSVYDNFAKDGKTPVFFIKDGELLGIIAIADTIKSDSADAVKQLKNMGIDVIMLTGDNKTTAEAIAKKVNIDKVISDVLPGEKEAVIRKMKNVIMVGDGINDAPALARADIGIAIGKGTDIAIDSADVVLISNKLSDVAASIKISRAALKTIHQNLFWAFIYNVICIPVAAGAFTWAGLTLNPMLSAAAMSLSSFCVVSNALRLNLINFDKKRKKEKKMEKKVVIKGMMCPHCEARVKKILENLSEIEEATVSHKEGTAILKCVSPISDETIKQVITNDGYEVIEIK